jgi:TRAP-type C4-dicarboxylate transport system substrate-binding protein
MQNPVFIEMFSSLGGSPVPMAWGEVFTAMQQGTVDGLEIPTSVVNSNNYAEVTKYLSFTRHTYSAIHLLMSERSFENLPEDVQQAVMQAGAAAIAKQRETVAAAEADVVAALKEKGMKINEIDDVGAFRAKVGPVYERFAPTIGDDLLETALQAVSSD